MAANLSAAFDNTAPTAKTPSLATAFNNTAPDALKGAFTARCVTTSDVGDISAGGTHDGVLLKTDDLVLSLGDSVPGAARLVRVGSGPIPEFIPANIDLQPYVKIEAGTVGAGKVYAITHDGLDYYDAAIVTPTPKVLSNQIMTNTAPTAKTV
jgi:hypothetical protein